jgi:hypothetical protein
LSSVPTAARGARRRAAAAACGPAAAAWRSPPAVWLAPHPHPGCSERDPCEPSTWLRAEGPRRPAQVVPGDVLLEEYIEGLGIVTVENMACRQHWRESTRQAANDPPQFPSAMRECDMKQRKGQRRITHRWLKVRQQVRVITDLLQLGNHIPHLRGPVA